MAKNVRVDQLAQELVMMVQQYTEDVAEAVELEADLTAEKIIQDVVRDSPRKTGKYARNWKITRQKGDGWVKNTIHNKIHQLVHLLEFGHAKAGGGRVDGRPHLGPAAERHIPAFLKRIEQIIRNGG